MLSTDPHPVKPLDAPGIAHCATKPFGPRNNDPHPTPRSHLVPSDFFEPRDTSSSLPIALLRTREAVMARFRPMLAGHGLTEQQWRVLRSLAEYEELEVSQLAEKAVILGPSLSRILRNFETQDLIAKRRDSGDRRRYFLSLTDAGKAVIARVQPDSVAIYREIEALMGIADMRALVDDLNAVAARLRAG
ncbi:MAG: homoprotocatechuate degradation regulator HpaR [Paracoccaceae bacterium]|jgi:homoprotocatechuate degradation regulator HpaR